MVFDRDAPRTKSCRYAAVIDGDMISVYAETKDADHTEEERAAQEGITVSIVRDGIRGRQARKE